MSSETLLPPNATAFERSLEAVVDRSLSVRVPVRDLWSPQDCPLAVLPWLAWSLSIDDWDPDWTEAQKRGAVASAIEVHRSKGTVGAVKRALSVLGYEVEIDEDTGQVYTFRVRLMSKVDDIPGPGDLDQAERLVKNTKNVRSHLLSVGTLERVNTDLELSVVQLSGEITQLWPAIIEEVESYPQLRILSAEQTIETTSVVPFFETQYTGNVAHAVAAVAYLNIKLIAEANHV